MEEGPGMVGNGSSEEDRRKRKVGCQLAVTTCVCRWEAENFGPILRGRPRERAVVANAVHMLQPSPTGGAPMVFSDT